MSRHTLTTRQIDSLKDGLARLTGKFIFDISDSEVFDEVERIREEENEKVGFGRKGFCSWDEAIEICEGYDYLPYI